MIRTLFREEFIRSILKAIVAAGALALLSIATKSLLVWLSEDPSEAQQIIEGCSAFIILGAAAGTGSSTFSRAFREGPLRLLDVLPIGRAWIWVMRVVTAFATAGTLAAMLILAQPTLISRFSLPDTLAFASCAALLFAIGCCISTLTTIQSIVTIALTAAVSIGILIPLTVAQAHVTLTLARPGGFFVTTIAGVVLFPLFLLFSLVVFVRGELDVRRRRWRNTLLGAGLVFASLFLTVTALDAGAFEPGSTWKTSEQIQVSDNGAYVSAVQFKGRYSPVFRVAIIDVATGDLLKTYEGRSQVGQVWTEDGALIVFTRDSALRYLLGFGSESVNAVRVFPSQQPLFRMTGYRLMATAADPRGPLMVLEESPPLAGPSHYVLLRLDSSGRTRELIRVPVRSPLVGLARAYDGSVLSVGWGSVWQVREDVVEITDSLGHFRFLSKEAMQRASASLTSGAPPAGPRALPGKYLLADRTLDFNESVWLYFLQSDPQTRRAVLWARRNGDTAWKEVLKHIPLSDLQVKDLSSKNAGLFTRQLYPEIRAITRSGIVTWIDSTSPKPRLTIFDLNSGERFDMGDIDIPGTGTLYTYFASLTGSRSLITVYRTGKGRASFLPGGFYYESGKGAPVRWTEPADPQNIVFKSKGGGYLYYRYGAEAGLQLFYAEPGLKPRLISMP